MKDRYVCVLLVGGFVTGIYITGNLLEAKQQADKWAESLQGDHFDDAVVFDRRVDDVVYSPFA